MAQDAMDLCKHLPAEAKKRAKAKAKLIILSNRLARLREAQGLTQKALARKLKIQQAAVSRLEGREDLRVSTVVRYLEALGGRNVRILTDIHGKRQTIQLTR